MGKIKIIFAMIFFVSFSAQAGYVRKLKEPNFFIPEGEGMHLQEKLPPVNKTKEDVVEKKGIKKEEVVAETPEYKKKYDNYLEDISVFVKTKQMPINDILENDLKSMESGDVFEVTQNSSQETKTEEQKKFEEILAEIMRD